MSSHPLPSMAMPAARSETANRLQGWAAMALTSISLYAQYRFTQAKGVA